MKKLLFPLLLMLLASQVFPLTQTERLACLGRVWGFLKYFHQGASSGSLNWDQVLIDTIPAVKGASDAASFNRVVNDLIHRAGVYTPRDRFTPGPYGDLSLFPWLERSELLGEGVKTELRKMVVDFRPFKNRYVEYSQLSLAKQGGEPLQFPVYYPDENHRLYALFQYWNVINYFFPYKDLIDEPWDAVLERFIEPVRNAADPFEFAGVMKRLTAGIDDAHSFMGSGFFELLAGHYFAPATVAFVEGKTVVDKIYSSLIPPDGGLRVGDVILKRGDVGVDALRASLYPYAHGSNEWTRQRTVNGYVMRGPEPLLRYTVERDGRVLELEVQGHDGYIMSLVRDRRRKAAVKWRVLPGNIGFVNMWALFKEDVDGMFGQLGDTRAIIFDLRAYPNETYYLISQYLNSEPRPFAMMRKPVIQCPGLFQLEVPDMVGKHNPDHYKGKVVLLVNEWTQSHAEYTCMAFQTAPDCTIIGSWTAGADGNVGRVKLPGRIVAMYSGFGVFYPDGRPTQQVGIVPDIFIRPTVTGIREGRDEVLERAVAFIEND
jgi:hypothetical protein